VSDPENRRLGALPTATGVVARLAYARAREAGVELKPLLKKAGLTKRQIEDDGIRLEVRQQISFLNVVADAVEDPLLGFHLAQLPDLRELGLVYYIAASSDTVGDAFRRAARYSSVVNEGVSLAYRDRNETALACHYVGVARHRDRHQMEFIVTLLVRLCRHLTGLRLAPSRVRFIHPRTDDRSELSAFFGGELEFARTADDVVFDTAIKDMPIVSADPYLNELLLENCEEAVARRSASRGSFRSAVENAIVPLLPHGKARADGIAGKLGLSQRTFARRLASEGLTFTEVLESLRGDLARQYLAHHALSVSQIAWLLGYQEVSAFTHAFKRWTGTTPRQVRAAY
jgi:AraC-like DNA-binding protein